MLRRGGCVLPRRLRTGCRAGDKPRQQQPGVALPQLLVQPVQVVEAKERHRVKKNVVNGSGERLRRERSCPS